MARCCQRSWQQRLTQSNAIPNPGRDWEEARLLLDLNPPYGKDAQHRHARARGNPRGGLQRARLLFRCHLQGR